MGARDRVDLVRGYLSSSRDFSIPAVDVLRGLLKPPCGRIVPRYLLDDPKYHGGADKQYAIAGDYEAHAKPAGWVARRWDPAVRERFAEVREEAIGRFAGAHERAGHDDIKADLQSAEEFAELPRLLATGVGERPQAVVLEPGRAVRHRLGVADEVEVHYAHCSGEW